MGKARGSYDWERLLAHAAILQAKVPSAVLVGGTAAALHARSPRLLRSRSCPEGPGHTLRKSDCRPRSIPGWRTKRRIRGKLVLGEVEGIDAGLRNQRRSAPLETTSIKLPGGRIPRYPRSRKCFGSRPSWVVERNATRDYLDVAALSHHLGTGKSVRAIEGMRQLYAEFAGEAGDMMISITVKG